ncbi:MAG: hypothetical protein WC223_01610 [Bacteroidales bacterium]|jgi:hypothetical protein
MENNISNKTLSSLCSTCVHENVCMYLQSYKGNILQCEEFSTEDNQMTDKNIIIQKEENKIQEQENRTGLCKNCDLRKTCMLYSPDRVVWHCEEYL